MSDQFTAMIKRHEGLRLRPYRDTVGKLTVGYGHNLDDKGISMAAAELLLQQDIAEARQQVARSFPWAKHLTEARQDVLHSMCFQLGINGLTGFAKMIDACRRGDYAKAAYEMTNSKWHDQTPKRCSELAAMMLHGEYATKETV